MTELYRVVELVEPVECRVRIPRARPQVHAWAVAQGRRIRATFPSEIDAHYYAQRRNQIIAEQSGR